LGRADGLNYLHLRLSLAWTVIKVSAGLVNMSNPFRTTPLCMELLRVNCTSSAQTKPKLSRRVSNWEKVK
jgi:hypothetical protein